MYLWLLNVTIDPMSDNFVRSPFQFFLSPIAEYLFYSYIW